MKPRILKVRHSLLREPTDVPYVLAEADAERDERKEKHGHRAPRVQRGSVAQLVNRRDRGDMHEGQTSPVFHTLVDNP